MVKSPSWQCKRYRRLRCDPSVRKIPWRRKWQSTPVLLPGKFHAQRSLAGYSPWGCGESDTTEQLSTHTAPRQWKVRLTQIGITDGALIKHFCSFQRFSQFFLTTTYPKRWRNIILVAAHYSYCTWLTSLHHLCSGMMILELVWETMNGGMLSPPEKPPRLGSVYAAALCK